jgi:predicted O-linked N-acetylglucosamine transferase (SPINDLY family)
MSVANSSDMQLLARQYVQKGDWDSALQLYEQAIAAEPNVKSHYWQLGLLLLLQGQEEEAQIVWFDALSTTESDAEMQTCTAELVEILDTEARSRENSADYQTAWLLRQYIGENQPEDIDNLLRSLILSIQLNLFIPDEDASLPQAISLLPHLSPTQVDDSLLLQVLQKILEFDKSSPISLQLVDACLAHYQDALTADPTIAEWHYRLGTIYAESQQTAEAIACYERALQLKPDYAEPYFSLGNIDLNQGNYEQAIANYKRAIRLNPSLAKAYVNLAFIQEQQGSFDVAIATLQAATQLQPSFATAFRNLGILLLKLEKLSEAEAICRDALKIAPDDVPARTTLADALIRQNRLEEAIDCLERAPTRHPDFAKSFCDIGNAMIGHNKLIEANACFEIATDINPHEAEAYAGMGFILLQQLKLDEAIAQYQKAIEVNPDLARAYANIGQAKSLQGRTDEATCYYQKALDIDSGLVCAYHIHLLLPILYDSEDQILTWRQRFTLGMNDFIKKISLRLETDRLACMESIGYRTNFYLAYQEQNDLELQCLYGQLVQKIMSANYPQWAEPLTMPPLGQNEKIRIGYISEFFRSHSVGNMTIGWLRYRDREKFEVYTYYTATKEDFMVEEFRQESDFFRHLPTSVEAICDRIRADRLHLLVFPDIGMQPQTTQIAGLRLAPVQCVWAGHPVTTGLPTMDYFLSSDLMETDEAQSHYSEQLVRLPKLGFAYAKPPMPSVLKSRADLQLPEDCILYVSCQTLFKYLPQYDYLFARIAARVPQAKLVFLGGVKDTYVTEQLKQRLHRVFSQAGLEMEQHCIILPRLDWEDYFNLLRVCNISLDTVGFSGGNTTLQAIAFNLPVVTFPSEFMRGRVSYGVLQTLGVLDTVASSLEDYVEIAVKLGTDRDWRRQIVEKISSHHHNLYDDRVAIKALEQFYQEVVVTDRTRRQST